MQYSFSTVQKKLSAALAGRAFTFLVLAVITLKLVLLPWAVHPFDFWTFVNTIQRSTLYGWNVFEYWNKGNFLIDLWYPLYSLYLKVLSVFTLTRDNLVLLFFLFKAPFLVIDLFCGFLLHQIVLKRSRSLLKSRVAFLAWFLNPLVYYVYGVHGHYEIVVPFSMLLLLYGLTYKKVIPLSIGIVLAFTTKYFILICLPFVLLFLVRGKYYKTIIASIALVCAGLVLSYLHLLADTGLARQAVASIINLSETNAPIGVHVVSIPALNVFSAFNYLFYSAQPIDSVRNTILFPLASKGSYIVLIILAIHLFYRVRYVIRSKAAYSLSMLIFDMALFIIYFPLLTTNFQPHYLIWCLPFLILLAADDDSLYIPFSLYTIAGFIFAYKNEIGPRTFFLDLGFYNGDLSLSRADSSLMYGTGAVVVAALVLIIIWLSVNRSKFFLSRRMEKVSRPIVVSAVCSLGVYFISVSILAILLVMPFYVTLRGLRVTSLPKELYYTRVNGLFRGVTYGTYSIQSIGNDGSIVTFNRNSSSNALIVEQVAAMSADLKKNFQAFILLTDKSREAQIESKLVGKTFNGCAIPGPTQVVEPLGLNDKLTGLAVPVECLNAKENILVVSEASGIKSSDIKLYISNVKSDALYLPENAVKITYYAWVGGAYLVLFAISSVAIIKKLALAKVL